MTVINVPTDYSTISSAIAASNSGDTIKVAAGIYNEYVDINVQNLTLLEGQANVNVHTHTFVVANESIITFAHLILELVLLIFLLLILSLMDSLFKE